MIDEVAVSVTINDHGRKTDMSRYMSKGYLSYKRPAKAQASLRISAVSPELLQFADM